MNLYRYPRQEGLSILEVLIALAVLSIGLAGLAIMHLNSLKYVKISYERSVASSIALDLEERLWLRLADTSSFGCPSLSTADGTVLAALADHWTDQTTSTLGDKKVFAAEIPNLTVTVEATRTVGTPGTGPAYAEVDLVLTWGEGVQRFNDNEDTGQSFRYTARIFCSADYITPS